MLTDKTLRDIVSRATPLQERLAPARRNRVPDGGALTRQMELWRDRAAQGNPVKFANRLSWDGQDEDGARAALASAPRIGALPGWALALREILRRPSASLPERPAGPGPGFPFEDALQPFAGHASERLAGLPLRAEVRQALVRDLLRRLTRIAAPTLLGVFEERRTCGHSLIARFAEELGLESDRTLYRSFVAELAGGGLVALFERYPVLARLLGTAFELWREDLEELLHRLDADLSALGQVFNGGEPLGEISGIECGLSDPHHGGRTVRRLTFTSEIKLLYKPRDLGIDEAWNGFLAWVNEHSGLPRLWSPRVMARDGYGWVEHVAEAAVAEEAGARRFYERAGMLVCLAYALQGNDFHRENVLASGEHPVLIDVESILNAEIRLGEKMERLRDAHRQRLRSVMSSGLLPRWVPVENGRAYDMSGLGSEGEDEAFGEGLAWRRVNTDDMHRTVQGFPLPGLRNAPVLGSAAARAEDHVAEIAGGFEGMYRFLLGRREEVLAPGGPLSAFRRRKTRVIYRDTALYMTLLDEALAPENLTCGIEHGLVFELLARTFHCDVAPEGIGHVFKAEVSALERLDVPCFSVVTDAEVFSPDGVHAVPRFFRRSGLAVAAEVFERLSESDLARQLGFIRSSFFAKAARTGTEPVLPASAAGNAPVQPADDFLGQAAAVGDEILSQAFGEAGSVAMWMDLQLLPECGRYQLQLLGPGLYGGGAGIALFLAALHACTGHAASRDTALRALAASRSALLDEGQDADWVRVTVHEMGIGAAEGVASLVYAHVGAARFLGEPSLLDHAVHLARFIDGEAVAADRALDVLAGSSGALLVLLALWEATGDPGVLERALACGNRLVASQLDAGRDAGGWIHACGRALTGFSHGAAGNAAALARLYAATSEPSFRRAALAALDFERRLFSPARRNWPDFRNGDDPAWAFGWCNGAPGIGLARIAVQRHLSDPFLQEEIETAVRAVEQSAPAAVDHLCCGAFGHVDLLLAAGRGEAARQRAAQAAGRAVSEGGFRLFPRLPRSARSYGLFQGLAGIGYQMLRLAAPDRVPSVLCFE